MIDRTTKFRMQRKSRESLRILCEQYMRPKVSYRMTVIPLRYFRYRTRVYNSTDLLWKTSGVVIIIISVLKYTGYVLMYTTKQYPSLAEFPVHCTAMTHVCVHTAECTADAGAPHDLCFLHRCNIVCPGRQGPPTPWPDHLYSTILMY
jgi:hypothetical protein